MEVGDLVRTHKRRTVDGEEGHAESVTGVIVKIERTKSTCDGPIDPIVTILSADGMISLPGRQLHDVGEGWRWND